MDSDTAEKLLQLVYLQAGSMHITIFGRYIVDTLLNKPEKRNINLLCRTGTISSSRESLIRFLESIRAHWHIFYPDQEIVLNFNELNNVFFLEFMDNDKPILTMQLYTPYSTINYRFSFDLLCSTNAELIDIKLMSRHSLDLVTILSGIYKDIIYDIRPDTGIFNTTFIKYCIELSKQFKIESIDGDKLIYNNECPVCLEIFKDTTLCYTNCGHAYHIKCLNDVRTNNLADARCSVCRTDISSIYYTGSSIQDK